MKLIIFSKYIFISEKINKLKKMDKKPFWSNFLSSYLSQQNIMK